MSNISINSVINIENCTDNHTKTDHFIKCNSSEECTNKNSKGKGNVNNVNNDVNVSVNIVNIADNNHKSSLNESTSSTSSSIDNDNNITKVNHNVYKTVNDINHINHRPSNLYFNPSRLNEDNQYPINDNTSEYYTDNEFVKAFNHFK